jgi:hypothetical protein
MYDDSNSHLHKEWGDGIKDKSRRKKSVQVRLKSTTTRRTMQLDEDQDVVT